MAPGISGPLVAASVARDAVADRALAHDAACRRAFAAFERLWRRSDARHGPATGPRALHECAAVPLLALLGYQRLAHSEAAGPDRVEGLVVAGPRTRTAVLTSAWGTDLDLAWRAAATLGARTGARWCLAFNGVALRLIDAARPFAQRFVEVDLAGASRHWASFAQLWLLARAASLAERGAPGDCDLDRLVAASLRQKALVCSALDVGVREAYGRIAGALHRAAGRREHRSDPPVAQQALTVVFRLLFLLYAESRGLAPLHHPDLSRRVRDRRAA